MCWVRGRWQRAGFGILLIVIGLLWFSQRAGWFPLEIFGPLVLLTFGVWVTVTSYFYKRQAPPSFPASSPSCSGSQFRPDGDEATRKDHAAANKMLCPQRLSEENHP